MLWLVGLPPSLDLIPPKVVRVCRKASRVLLERYTNYPWIKTEELSNLFKREIEEVSREYLENKSEAIVKSAKAENIVILSFGNPLVATTHYSLILECQRSKIKFDIIHSPSIFDFVLETGLHFYKFGITVSIPFREKVALPFSVYEKVKKNLKAGAHTLILLDASPEEGRYMSIKEALNILLELEQRIKEGLFSEEKRLLACSRLGTPERKIVYGEIKKLMEIDIGPPPYCLVYPASLHFTEKEALQKFEII